jgi:hypothetical protein
VVEREREIGRERGRERRRERNLKKDSNINRLKVRG